MNQRLMNRTVVGARFATAGRMYFFDPGDVTDYAVNDWVIVRTDLGEDAARVHILPTDSPLVQVDMPLGRVVRKATASDKFELARRKRMETDSTETARELVRQHKLPIKVAGTDWQLDGSTLTVFYSSDERPDLTAYATALAAQIGARIELERVSAREETKVTTGVGTCGRELCCSSWLDKFSNISIRMAKEQDLALNQSKLTGNCGRLKCCLIYELETYQEVKGKLPKLGETFHIPSCGGDACGTGGCAQTQGVSMTKESIVVGMIDGSRSTLTADELGVKFAPVPARIKGQTYGSDEIMRPERATPQPLSAGGKRRRRRGGRRGGRGAPPPNAPNQDAG